MAHALMAAGTTRSEFARLRAETPDGGAIVRSPAAIRRALPDP